MSETPATAKPTEAPKAPAKKPAPRVRVKGRGQISTTLETLAERFRELNPEMDVRYVYDPLHKPELSGVLGRQAAGYEHVLMGELQLDLKGSQKPEDVVRVADLILMKISRIERAGLIEERQEIAEAQRDTIRAEFYESQNKAGDSARKGHHTRNPTKAIGTVEIRNQEFSYDIEQGGGTE